VATRDDERSRRGIVPFLARLVETLDLPKDLVFDLPRITIVGGLQVTVENHRGLVEFTPTRVTVATRDGRIVIEGRELGIGVVHEEEITVTGELASVTFQR
jgi:sporulation protein YqfC